MRKAKRWVKVLVGILLAVVLLVGAYVAYVFLDYHRIGDQELEAQGEGGATALDTAASYSILSYNIGFGAYEDDYGFFMDGGTERGTSDGKSESHCRFSERTGGFLSRTGGGH